MKKFVYSRIADAFLIAVSTFLMTFLTGVWDWFPKGGDADAHLTRVKFLIDYWPHSNWGYLWSAGAPFLAWYAYLPYYVILLFVKVAGASPEFSMTFLFVIGMFLSAIAVYWIVYSVVGERLPSLISSLMASTSGLLWNGGIGWGLYPRMFSLPFVLLSIFLGVRLVKNINARNSSKGSLFGLIMAVGIAAQGHPLMGAVAATVTLLILLACIKNWKLKLLTSIRVFLPAFLLSAYFYVPTLIMGEVKYQQLWGTLNPWKYRINPLEILFNASLYPIIMPLLLSLLTLRLLFVRKWTEGDLGKRVLLLFTLSCPIPILLELYIFGYNIGTVDVFFIVVFLILNCGILLGQIVGRIKSAHTRLWKIARILLIALICTIIISPIYPVKQFNFHIEMKPYNRAGDEVIYQLLKRAPDDGNSRFGVIDGIEPFSYWFNYKYSVPETHTSIGTIIPGWKAWLDESVWIRKDNYEETNYLLGWFAVKWFIVPPLSYNGSIYHNYEKFLGKPQFYYLIANQDDVYGFIYARSEPIVSINYAPTLLVIGDDDAYTNVFRSLAYSDCGSSDVIPIWGQKYIDEYTLDELKKFDAVFLYGYDYSNSGLAWDLLRRYVEGGGGLIVDTGHSPDANSSFIPPPIPVSRTVWTDFGIKWGLVAADSPLTKGVNITGFSPAIYETSDKIAHPWGISASFNESVRGWARTVLSANGRPLVVMGKYGSGTVVWSGLNLPYHTAVYRNSMESLILSRMIFYVSGQYENLAVEKPSYVVERKDPDNLILTVLERCRGVMFKEAYFSDYVFSWHAYLVQEGDSSQEIEIYRAGPGFMYVHLPEGLKYPLRIAFNFKSQWGRYVSYLISVAAFFVLLAYRFAPSIFKRIGYPYTCLTDKTKKYVERLKRKWSEE